jgi:hypothetical protein
MFKERACIKETRMVLPMSMRIEFCALWVAKMHDYISDEAEQ